MKTPVDYKLLVCLGGNWLIFNLLKVGVGQLYAIWCPWMSIENFRQKKITHPTLIKKNMMNKKQNKENLKDVSKC